MNTGYYVLTATIQLKQKYKANTSTQAIYLKKLKKTKG